MVNIQLDDSVAAILIGHAQAQGLSLEAYLEQLATSATQTTSPRMSGQEFLRLLDEASVAGPVAQCTYSRADIYLDHD